MALTFDISITRTQAVNLIYLSANRLFNFDIMCEEYGEDEDWQEVNNGDLHTDENGDFTLDENYQTFEIWICPHKNNFEEVVNYLSSGYVLDCADMERQFDAWKESDNVIKSESDCYKTQCSQYSIPMSLIELKNYFTQNYFINQ